MIDTEALVKLKELLDSGAISQDEYDVQKKSILQSEDKPIKKKNGGLIATIAVVIILCIAIISGNSPKSSETVVIEQNKNTETVSVKEQEPEKTVEFSRNVR